RRNPFRFMHFASWPYSRSANGIGCLTALRQGPEGNSEDQLRAGRPRRSRRRSALPPGRTTGLTGARLRFNADGKAEQLKYHLHAPAGFASWAFASLPDNQPLQFFGGEVTICQQGWRG